MEIILKPRFFLQRLGGNDIQTRSLSHRTTSLILFVVMARKPLEIVSSQFPGRALSAGEKALTTCFPV
jgi:hypothetical protein